MNAPIDLKQATQYQLAYRARLIEILEACKWNVSWAADKAKVSRVTLYRHMAILSVKPPENAKRPRGARLFTKLLPSPNEPDFGTLPPDLRLTNPRTGKPRLPIFGRR